MQLLQVACGDVVHDGVAEHMVERIGLPDAAAALADDDGELGLVVELPDHMRVPRNGVAGADDRGERLGEHHRRLGRVLAFLRAAVETGLAELGRVIGVVLAHAEDVAARLGHRRQQPGAGQRPAFTRARAGQWVLQAVEVGDQVDEVAGEAGHEVRDRPIALGLRVDQHRNGTAGNGNGCEFHGTGRRRLGGKMVGLRETQCRTKMTRHQYQWRIFMNQLVPITRPDRSSE